MEGARLPGRGPPFMGPLPFIIGPLTGGPRGIGAEDCLGGWLHAILRRLCGSYWGSRACSVDDVEVMKCGV